MLNILKALNLGLIAGFAVGLVITFFHITDHRLLYYNLYNLMLLDIQSIVTDYFILFALISLSLVIFDRLLKRILQSKILKRFDDRGLENKVPLAISISLVLYAAIALICYLKLNLFVDIHVIEPLQNTSIVKPVLVFSEARSNTYLIYFILFLVTFISFISVSTYLLVRFNIAAEIQKKLSALANSRVVQTLGISIIVIVLIYNAVIFKYKELNKPDGPNVILIVIDTLRADRLGSYGHWRNTSPNIDKLAEKGILFENAYSQAPWTLPSMTTIHTSLYPAEHGMIYRHLKINNSVNTLAENMKNSFYKTMALTTHPFVHSKYGFSQGFDIFDDGNHHGVNDTSSGRITQEAIDLLTKHKNDKFFLWVHYFDPHAAYIDHEEYNYGKGYSGNLAKSLNIGTHTEQMGTEDIQHVRNIYDEEISYTDKSVGELIDALEKLGLDKNTVIIITSDHGEELLDRTMFGHGRNTYQELIHVPLIIYNPFEREGEGLRLRHSVETRYIAKTILGICGIDDNHFSGRNLLYTAKEGGDTSSHLAFSEGSKNRTIGTLNHAVVGDNWKLIRNLRDDTFELYDLENDPGEKINLFESTEPDVELMRNKLFSGLSTFKKERLVELDNVELSREEIEELKALGYVQ